MNLRQLHLPKLASAICAAAFLCAVSPASAQAVYKEVDAAGRTTFADRLDALPSSRPGNVPASDVASALARNSAIYSRRAAMIDAREAARRLRQALLQRAQGAAVLPGEQPHGSTAGEVRHRYWRRQEQLMHTVEQAQRRSNETRPPERSILSGPRGAR